MNWTDLNGLLVDAFPPPPPPLLVRADNFNRADTATAGLNTPSDGGSAWVGLATGSFLGTFGISSGRAYAPSGQNPIAYIESGLSDCDLSVTDYSMSANGEAIIFRLTDANNYLRAAWSLNGVLAIRKTVAGTASLVAQSVATCTSGDTIRVALRGSSMFVYRTPAGGSEVSILSTGDVFNQTATKHGLFIYNSLTPRLDDFLIVAPPDTAAPCLFPNAVSVP